jgi:hypothetical protein
MNTKERCSSTDDTIQGDSGDAHELSHQWIFRVTQRGSTRCLKHLAAPRTLDPDRP